MASATDVAKYLLALAFEDGDTVTNLKMQKLVYYAYAHVLVGLDRKLFSEPIQAWANGPVVWELYSQLKRYGRGAIGEDFLGDGLGDELERLSAPFPSDVLEILNGVYEAYIGKSAFELVALTQNERSWQEARRGLSAQEPSSNVIADGDIIAQFTGV